VYIWSTTAVLCCARKGTLDAQRLVVSNTAYVYHHECTPFFISYREDLYVGKYPALTRVRPG